MPSPGSTAEVVTGASLDVLVVAYNSESTLPALLRSVAEQLPSGTRVAIWSNSDPRPLKDVVARDPHLPADSVLVLGGGENLGFARACNALAAWSDRENLFFLNPDAAVENWPPHLSLEPRTIKAPVVLGSDSDPQESYGDARTVLDEISIRLLRRHPKRSNSQSQFPVGFVSGAAFLVRRREFIDAGGFNEDYFMYYEDLDLGKRWATTGGTLWVEPKWIVRHIGGASANSDRLSALQRSQLSAERYHAHWSGGVRVFRAVCTVEALLKTIMAFAVGRAGQIDRRTQFTYTKWLLSRWSGSRAA